MYGVFKVLNIFNSILFYFFYALSVSIQFRHNNVSPNHCEILIETIVWCIFLGQYKHFYHSSVDSIFLTSKLRY